MTKVRRTLFMQLKLFIQLVNTKVLENFLLKITLEFHHWMHLSKSLQYLTVEITILIYLSETKHNHNTNSQSFETEKFGIWKCFILSHFKILSPYSKNGMSITRWKNRIYRDRQDAKTEFWTISSLLNPLYSFLPVNIQQNLNHLIKMITISLHFQQLNNKFNLLQMHCKICIVIFSLLWPFYGTTFDCSEWYHSIFIGEQYFKHCHQVNSNWKNWKLKLTVLVLFLNIVLFQKIFFIWSRCVLWFFWLTSNLISSKASKTFSHDTSIKASEK